MRYHITHIGAAVLTAALAIACSGANDQVNNDRRAQGGGDKRGTSETVKIDGCVQAAPSGHEFVLRDVSVPQPSEQPIGQEQMEHRVPIEQGSWVRLTGNNDVKSYLGKRVEVTGHVEDSGANTLGTSGRTTPTRDAQTNDEKFKRSSKDASTNPNREMAPTTSAPAGADANGTAPRIAVERVSKLADSCEPKR